MIFIYGDSHAKFSFLKLDLPFMDKHEVSITMHRLGRDNVINNFNSNEHDHDSILIFNYGEIDCRCHIQKQINAGGNKDEIIKTLVNNYFTTIKNSINKYKKIIVVGIIPPTQQNDYEELYGPITHEFPFVGTDNERVEYTIKMNNLIEEQCNFNNFIYFNPYDYYTRTNGTLKYELSDKCVHLGDNSIFLKKFSELYTSILSSTI